jgi:hypothetical protein
LDFLLGIPTTREVSNGVVQARSAKFLPNGFVTQFLLQFRFSTVSECGFTVVDRL